MPARRPAAWQRQAPTSVRVAMPSLPSGLTALSAIPASQHQQPPIPRHPRKSLLKPPLRRRCKGWRCTNRSSHDAGQQVPLHPAAEVDVGTPRFPECRRSRSCGHHDRSRRAPDRDRTGGNCGHRAKPWRQQQGPLGHADRQWKMCQWVHRLRYCLQHREWSFGGKPERRTPSGFAR
jgi:hypothetical protein